MAAVILHCEKMRTKRNNTGNIPKKTKKLKHKKIMKLLMALPFPFRLVRFSGAARRRLNREDENVIDPYDAAHLIPKNKIRKQFYSI